MSSSATASSSPPINDIAVTLEHWHYEVFNAPKADNDPALADINWKIQFQTNVKGDVDAVAVPLEPSVKPIVFARRPDRKLSDPEYLRRFEGEYELAGEPATVRLQGHVLILKQANGAGRSSWSPTATMNSTSRGRPA